MSSERVSTFFSKSEDFEELLDSAEENDPRGHDADFVAGMRENFENYGVGMYLSRRNKERLERIAGVAA